MRATGSQITEPKGLWVGRSWRSNDVQGSQRTSLLEVQDAHVRFGGIVALDGLSFTVATGEICGLIGPNGAGKSSLFNCVSGLYDLTSGRIILDGQSIKSVAPHRIAARGVARTFQHTALFQSLTVIENIIVGAQLRGRCNYWADALRLPSRAKSETNLDQTARELAQFVGIEDVLFASVSSLSCGYQKRVEIARALATGPRLIMLDEPAAGLNHEEVEDLARLIITLRDKFSMTVLLVEHHMGLVMDVSEKIVVLNFGRKIAEGKPAVIQRDPAVIEAYLGS